MLSTLDKTTHTCKPISPYVYLHINFSENSHYRDTINNSHSLYHYGDYQLSTLDSFLLSFTLP